MFTKNSTCLLVLGLALLAFNSPDASATLVVTNGTFTQGGGFNANVVDWFDGTAGGNPWEDTFIDTNPFPPASGTEVVFSGNASPTPQNFLYQNIGTKDPGDGTLNYSINIGVFSTNQDFRSGTLEVGLFQSGTFAGADGTDVLGAGGVTQIDAMDINIISRGGASPNQADETGSFSLASANLTDSIFLRFHWTPSNPTANYYLGADNVTITVEAAPEQPPAAGTPEPSTLILAICGLVVFVASSRRKLCRE